MVVYKTGLLRDFLITECRTEESDWVSERRFGTGSTRYRKPLHFPVLIPFRVLYSRGVLTPGSFAGGFLFKLPDKMFVLNHACPATGGGVTLSGRPEAKELHGSLLPCVVRRMSCVPFLAEFR